MSDLPSPSASTFSFWNLKGKTVQSKDARKQSQQEQLLVKFVTQVTIVTSDSWKKNRVYGTSFPSSGKKKMRKKSLYISIAIWHTISSRKRQKCLFCSQFSEVFMQQTPPNWQTSVSIIFSQRSCKENGLGYGKWKWENNVRDKPSWHNFAWLYCVILLVKHGFHFLRTVLNLY